MFVRRVAVIMAAMSENDLFQAALGPLAPWLVQRCAFDEAVGRLDIHLDFPRGSVFACPLCGTPGKAYDTDQMTWRHLDFFQHQACLHARTPRVECPQCGVRRASVPWARPGSGFTLLFEAFVMMLAKSAPVSAAARLVREHDTLVWRIVTHYVDAARAQAHHSAVAQVGVDETASRRGYNYMSLFVDLQLRKVLFAAPGKDASTVGSFARDLQLHGGDALAVTEVSADMSQAFSKGVAEHLPNAQITFDKFHVVSLVGTAVEQVRRLEQKSRPELSGTHFAWLSNPANLSPKQSAQIDALCLPASHLKTARAYQIRLSFQDLFKQPAEQAEAYLDKWYFWATHSRLPPIVAVAKTVRKHQQGILRWFVSGVNNGILEGINSLVQAAKAKARGYRSNRNLATIIYLIAGKLNLPHLPT